MISEEEFLKIVAGLRFAGPNTDLSKLFMRHERVNDRNVEVRCPVCKQNMWEKRDGVFSCWNCNDPEFQ